MRKLAVVLYAVAALIILLPMLTTSYATHLRLEQTISRRQSVRSYSNENITGQQLIDVLKLSYGMWKAHKSIPPIGCDYSLIIFPVNATASYRYIPETDTLTIHNINVNKETIRLHDSNWPSDASVVLVVVWNKTRMNNPYFASAEAGCLVQNVYLAAASLELGTCCVGFIDSEGLRKDLNLPNDLIPLIVMPLGYPANPYPDASPNYEYMTGNLPPVKYSPLSFEDALRNMMFTHDWSTENLSSQMISQLLWAAYGYTNIKYGASYHRTTPSAHGIYPLVIYILNATGTYQYLPENHSTAQKLQGDKRLATANACSGQSWAAKAPAIFLIVYNSSYNNGWTGDGGTLPHEFIEINAGAVIQQLFLEASAWNLSANIVTSGLEDWNGKGADELRNILNLPKSLIPLYIVPIGFRALDTTPPKIGIPFQNPEPAIVEPHQKVTITVNVVDEETGVREVILSYSINESQTWINITMKNNLNSTYAIEIPGFEANTRVQYKIVAYDNANNTAVEDNEGIYYVYIVIPEFQNYTTLIFISITLLILILTKRKLPNFKSPKTKKQGSY
ncbi:MAG: nitroreductase family protein [Candidatus Bathyarchaeia archaeon]